MSATVLIADHDRANLAFLCKQLLGQGFNVITASDGESALEKFTSQGPDVVLLDIWLPGLNGIEVYRRMKSDSKRHATPIALMDGVSFGFGAEELVAADTQAGAILKLEALLRSKCHLDGQAESVLMALARTIESRDPYSVGHCERLADYATRLGAKVRLPHDQIEALEIAGVLHDIGKVCVPDAILLKKGPLNARERRVMRAHPVVGERICAPLRSLAAILPAIRHHHERMDGSGYPDGISGDRIPLLARILQIADIYDALTTERPYRKALTPRQALAVLRGEAARGWRDASLIVGFEGVVC